MREGLRASQSRLRKAWRRARDDGGEARMHDWRKRLKDRTTQVEFFSDGVDEQLKSFCKQTKKLGEVLGEEHDLAVLNERLIALQSRVHPHHGLKALLGRIERRRSKLNFI